MDAEQFLALAKQQFPDKVTNEDYVLQFAKICAGNLNPMCTAVGGIVAQEVMKATSGKFSPIYQWMYFDALECLPEDKSKLTEENCKPVGSRYGLIFHPPSKNYAKIMWRRRAGENLTSWQFHLKTNFLSFLPFRKK